MGRKRYRVGMIGFGHIHVVGAAETYARHPQVEMVACADTIPLVPEKRKAMLTRGWNLEQAVQKAGIARTHDDYRPMLDREELDLVVVQSELAQHADVVCACAAHGVHVVVEKPLATNMDEALRMRRACHRAGTKLITNWPPAFDGWNHTIKRAVDEGAIGRVLEFRLKYGNNGPIGGCAGKPAAAGKEDPLTEEELAATWWYQRAAGGGALLDFCGYGCMYSRWYIGERPTAATALAMNLNTPWADVEDNALMVIRYPQAFALAESTWTAGPGGTPAGPFVLGTDGALMLDQKDGGRAVSLRRVGREKVFLEDRPLPAGRSNVVEDVIHHLDTGEPLNPMLDLPVNLDVMATLDAGIRSARSGRLEIVNSAEWALT